MMALISFYSCSKSEQEVDASEDPAGIEMSDSGELDAEGNEVAATEGDALEDEFSDELSDDGSVASADSSSSEDEFATEDFGGELADAGGSTSTEELGGDMSTAPSDLADVSEPGANVDSGAGFGSEAAAPAADAFASAQPSNPAVSIQPTGDELTYTVQPNETLMLIAFKLYGDYSRWKEIAQLNQDKLAGGTNISTGTQLRYNSAGSGFSWSPQGNPYLIQRGDTLSLISDKVYGTIMKWRKIWDNNRPLIKDANKIYVGFTIYYVPEEGRDVASGAGSVSPKTAPTVEAAPAESVNAAPAVDSVDGMDSDFPSDI